MTGMEWKEIFGGAYEVSYAGSVRRLWGGKGAKPGKILRQQLKSGYRSVAISVKGFGKRYYVHHLVAEAFIGPRPEGHVIHHKDGNRSNNVAFNLEYATPQQNSLYAGMAGFLVQGEGHGYAKLDEEGVRELRKMYAGGAKLSAVARTFGVSPSTAHAAIHGRTWKRSFVEDQGGTYEARKVFAPHAKLTEDQVRECRKLFAEGTQQVELCKIFGVTHGTMHHIVHRITWKGVT